MEKKILFKKEDFNFLLKVVFVLMLIFFVSEISPFKLQNDTLYDIVLGQRYYTQGMFHIDDYSIHQNLVYQTHHYYVCIAEYLVYHLFGFPGIHIFEVVLAWLVALLFYINNKYFTKNKAVSYVLTYFEMFCLKDFISLRAQMFDYIIFLLEIFLINKLLDTKKKRYVALLAMLPLILINVHSGTIFFFFIILGVYLLNIFKFKFSRLQNDTRFDKKILKYFAAIFLIGALLTLVNPYGYKAITYGIKTVNDTFINNYISEFLPYSIRDSNGKIVLVYVAFIYLSLIFSRKKINLQELLLTGGTTLMLLMSKRHFSIFLVSTVCLYPHVMDVFEQLIEKLKLMLKTQKKIVISKYICIAVLVVMYSWYLSDYIFSYSHALDNYLPDDMYPIKATEYIKKNLPSDARIFNEYGWGSYLMFNNIKVFIDSRADLYTPEYNKGTSVAQDYIDTINCNKYYADTFKKYNIQYLLIGKNVNLAKMIVYDSNYKVIYSDDMAYIFKVLDNKNN